MVLDAGAIVFVYFYRTGIEIFETVEVDHIHVVTITVMAVAVRLHPAGFAKSVINMIFVEVIRSLFVYTTQEGELFFWCKGE